MASLDRQAARKVSKREIWESFSHDQQSFIRSVAEQFGVKFIYNKTQQIYWKRT